MLMVSCTVQPTPIISPAQTEIPNQSTSTDTVSPDYLPKLTSTPEGVKYIASIPKEFTSADRPNLYEVSLDVLENAAVGNPQKLEEFADYQRKLKTSYATLGWDENGDYDPKLVVVQTTPDSQGNRKSEYWLMTYMGGKQYINVSVGDNIVTNVSREVVYLPGGTAVITINGKQIIIAEQQSEGIVVVESLSTKPPFEVSGPGSTGTTKPIGALKQMDILPQTTPITAVEPTTISPVLEIPKDVDETIWKAAIAETANNKEIAALTEKGLKPVWNSERKLIEIGDAHKDGFAWNEELKFWGKLVPISKYDFETKTCIPSGSYFVARYLINPNGRVAERAALQLSSQEYDGVIKMSGVSRIETVVALGKDIQYNLVGMVMETGEMDLTNYLINNIQNLSETEAGIFYKGNNQVFKTAKIQVADSAGNLHIITALICPKDKSDMSIVGEVGNNDVYTWADKMDKLIPGNLIEIFFAVPQRPNSLDKDPQMVKYRELYINFGVNSGIAMIAKQLGVPPLQEEVVYGLNKELHGIAVTHDVKKLALDKTFMASYILLNTP
jgi:hypothetical protein